MGLIQTSLKLSCKLKLNIFFIPFYFTISILSLPFQIYRYLSASSSHPYVNCFCLVTFPSPTFGLYFSVSVLSDWIPLSLDDKTAQKLLWISEGGSKVARTSDAVCPYPNRPERYEHSPQVGLAVVMGNRVHSYHT